VNELVLRGFGGVPEITADAFQLREKAVALAKPIQKVATEQEQTAAVAALRELKAIRTGMESTRKAVKAPVLDLARKIDNIAGDFVSEIIDEELRLQGMINHYQRKQLDAQREEQERLQREAQTAEELKRKAEQETNPERKSDLEARALDMELGSEVSAPLAVAKPKGLVVRERVNFKLTDAIVFCQGYPQFWKWNTENESLKLDRMAILDELNHPSGKGLFHRTHWPECLTADPAKPELVRPPGMEVFLETKSHVR
jgi:hypothetical protein